MKPDDRQSDAWAEKYRELLRGYVDALGGKDITPTRRALAETIATAQTELSTLTDRFASSGRGGSPEDLALFLKLSSTVAELMQSAGLGPSLQQPIVDQNRGDDARDKLLATFNNIIRAKQTENAQGIFRDADHRVITDPARLQIEQEIYRLTQARDALDNGVTIDATPDPEPLVINKIPPPAAPALSVVAGTDAVRPDAVKPAEPRPRSGDCAGAPDSSQLEEKRHQLVHKRDELQRERRRCADDALGDTAARAKLEKLIADQAAVDSELKEIDTAIAEAAPNSTPRYLDWAGSAPLYWGPIGSSGGFP